MMDVNHSHCEWGYHGCWLFYCMSWLTFVNSNINPLLRQVGFACVCSGSD